MKEKLIELERVLNSVVNEIENALYFENVSIAELDEQLKEWEDEFGYSKEDANRFKHHISLIQSKEYLKKIKNTDIPRVSELLTSALQKCTILESTNPNPNPEFKALVSQNIITTTQEIFGSFKKQTFVGYLTNDGFFSLVINGTHFKCSDFKYATLKAWNKRIPNDGWEIWRTLDSKTGKVETLKYFRNLLKIY